MTSILSIDYGLKRIGLATSDLSRTFAFPNGVVENKNNKYVIAELKKVIEEKEIGLILIGLPLNMDSSKGVMAENVEKFVSILEKEIGLPVVKIDERLSSFEAEERLKEANLKGKRIKDMVDAEAARILLEEYIANEK